jgi:hypothetical protein
MHWYVRGRFFTRKSVFVDRQRLASSTWFGRNHCSDTGTIEAKAGTVEHLLVEVEPLLLSYARLAKRGTTVCVCPVVERRLFRHYCAHRWYRYRWRTYGQTTPSTGRCHHKYAVRRRNCWQDAWCVLNPVEHPLRWW